MARTYHGDRVAHGIAGSSDKDSRQQQNRQRHHGPARQGFGNGECGNIELEVVESLGQIDHTGDLVENPGTTQQREPDGGGDRRHDTNRKNHLPDGASPGDPRNKNGHQRPITQEPGKEEHRPPLHPPAFSGARRYGSHGEKGSDVFAKALSVSIGQKQCRTKDEDNGGNGQGKKHVETAQQLNSPVNTGHRRGHIHTGKHRENDQLGAIAFGKSEQLMQAKTDLGGKKPDRADGASNHRNYAGSVNAAAEPALHYPIPKHRIQQGSRLQRLALYVMGVGQDDGRQGSEDCPGQKAPVHERLGQRRRYGLGRTRFGVEYRRRDNEVVDRLTRREEDATAGKQGAHDDGQPFKRTELRRIAVANLGAACRRDCHTHPDQKGE